MLPTAHAYRSQSKSFSFWAKSAAVESSLKGIDILKIKLGNFEY